MMEKSLALIFNLLLACLSISVDGAEWVRSDPVTLRFGIEADWTNSMAVDARHADVSIYYCGGLGASYYRAEAPPAATNVAVSLAHLHANTNTREVLPSVPPAYTFLGVTNNQRFWNLEQNFFPGQLWLGLRGEGDMSRLALWNPNNQSSSGVYFRLELLAVRGPAAGHFSLFQWGSPPAVYWATSDGVTTGDVFHLAAGGHDHFNWSFTQPGLYEVDLRVGTFVNAPTSAPPALTLAMMAAGQLVTTWSCDPCFRYWMEQSAGSPMTGTWTPAGVTASTDFASGTLVLTNGMNDVTGAALIRLGGRP